MTEPIARLDQVTVTRSGRIILDRLDLAVTSSASLLLQGPSGSGKSTILAILAGLEQPDSGTVHRQIESEQIGIVLQGYGLVSLLTAAENVALPLQTPARPTLAREVTRSRAAAALDQVGLAPFAGHLVEALSVGQQQRVAIARALITKPALLIADEPTAALDADSRRRIADLLFALPATGTAVVIASHDATLASRSDQVVHLRPIR